MTRARCRCGLGGWRRRLRRRRIPGGWKSARRARKSGQSFEEPGDDRGEGCIVLGGPDTRLAVSPFVDGYGDFFHHDCSAFLAEMSATGMAGGQTPSMIVRWGKEIICKSVVCDRFFGGGCGLGSVCGCSPRLLAGDNRTCRETRLLVLTGLFVRSQPWLNHPDLREGGRAWLGKNGGGFRLVASHPCDRKKSQGWGTLICGDSSLNRTEGCATRPIELA